MPLYPGWGPDNPFYKDFETTPEGRRANYLSFQGAFAAQPGGSPNKMKWFQQQFQNVQDKFEGLGAAYLKQGGQDPQSWSALLEDYFAPQGGAQQEYAGLSPRMRGDQQGRFSPPARWFV